MYAKLNRNAILLNEKPLLLNFRPYLIVVAKPVLRQHLLFNLVRNHPKSKDSEQMFTQHRESSASSRKFRQYKDVTFGPFDPAYCIKRETFLFYNATVP